ncbi:MAG: hypothetical protein ACR2MG_04395 [Pyrinomonadaceae bacterium]
MIKKSFLQSIFIALIFVCLTANVAFAQTTAFNYQGKLTDSGTPQAIYQMEFRLYGSAGGNDQIGATITNGNVAVNQGVFTVLLDFDTSAGAPAFPGADRFLQISVRRSASESFVTLNPRQQITSSPYSIRTLSATSADALSGSCIGCVTNAQINSIDGGKVTGTVANAANAQNVTGVVGVSNGGTGLSSSGAAGNFLRSSGGTWTSSALQAADIPAGNANYIQNQSAVAQSASMRIDGQIRTGNMLRVGSETGTTNVPGEFITGFGGLVIRRIESRNLNGVIARTDVLQLGRDGTAAGLWIYYSAALTSPQTVHCTGVNSSGATVNSRRMLPVGTPSGGIQIYSDAQNLEYVQCSFGDTFNDKHVTQVVLQRYQNDSYWIGTVTSTYNQ